VGARVKGACTGQCVPPVWYTCFLFPRRIHTTTPALRHWSSRSLFAYQVTGLQLKPVQRAARACVPVVPRCGTSLRITCAPFFRQQ